MSRILSTVTLQDALSTEVKANSDYVRSVLRDVLAEVVKGECEEIESYYANADCYTSLLTSAPDPCGTCIVCLAREVTKVE